MANSSASSNGLGFAKKREIGRSAIPSSDDFRFFDTRSEVSMTISATAFLSALPMIALLAAPAAAQTDLLVYPAKGQSEAQQAQDRSECSTWATQQTNFDPTTPAPVYTPPTQQRGGALRGAAGGAAVGAIGGAIAGDAGKGAAIGAGVGGGGGAIRQRRSNTGATDTNSQAQANADAAYQQALAEYNQKRETHKKAVATCLQGRGYTVN
jgi:hypothetical protein